MKSRPDHIDSTIDGDLQALRSTTQERLSALEETSRAVQRKNANTTAGGTLVKTIRRPRVLGALGTAVLALALAIIPIPYTRTVGHDVTLSLAALPPPAIKKVARQLKQALGAQSVAVRADESGVTLTAKATDRSKTHVEKITAALVKSLGERKIVAKAAIAPRTEQVSGSVYAMAVDRIVEIRVDTAGKSDEQIEDEIRAQLAEAGFDADVAVSRQGDRTRIDIAADADDGDRQLRIVRDTKGGPPQIQMQLDIDHKREPGMTDAQLKEKIERQLRARGLDPVVTVEGDRVEIQARKEVEHP